MIGKGLSRVRHKFKYLSKFNLDNRNGVITMKKILSIGLSFIFLMSFLSFYFVEDVSAGLKEYEVVFLDGQTIIAQYELLDFVPPQDFNFSNCVAACKSDVCSNNCGEIIDECEGDKACEEYFSCWCKNCGNWCEKTYCVWDSSTGIEYGFVGIKTLPYTISIQRCTQLNYSEVFSYANIAHAGCQDLRNSSCKDWKDIFTTPENCGYYDVENFVCDCKPTGNYKCDVVYEQYELYLTYCTEGSTTIYVNGNPIELASGCNSKAIIFVSEKIVENQLQGDTYIVGIPSSITINANMGEIEGLGYKLSRGCLWSCGEKSTVLPISVIYPKVDIEQFSITGGPSVIQNGKVISAFTMTPGSQEVFLQVENRGFFTQKDARVKFEGFPNGVTVNIKPDTQTIKAHNLGTYSANFTLDANVPSGKYQVTMVAYSPKGTFDKITFDFIVP